ncbi:MAG: TetR/AcrR family transcriptional regulator [SAR202 cluster bacterium]|nr:TetR/AcrR family transcriptional regulator [SAR202 cluster bacterium]
MVRQNSTIRKHQIVEAARGLITEKGMDAVTIDAIADAVGLSEGAIYRHFSSKRQILLLLIDELEHDLLSAVARAQETEPNALRVLECILETHLADVEGSRGVSFVVVSGAVIFEGIGLADRVRDMLERYMEILKGVMQRGVEEGTFQSDLDVEAAALTFFGMIQSTATIWALSGYSWSLEQWRSQIFQVYKNGVAAT